MSNPIGDSHSAGYGRSPAGWYTIEGEQRYWNGTEWTEHVAPLADRSKKKTTASASSGFSDETIQSQVSPGQHDTALDEHMSFEQARQQQARHGTSSAASNDETNLAVLAHLGGIFGFVPSLVIWLLKKDESPFVARHALKALNFQLVLAIGWLVWVFYLIVNSFIEIPFVGILLFLGLLVFSAVFSILGAVAVSKGDDYDYPVDPKFIK